MAKKKITAIVASAALAAMLGLTACGGQAASSSASAAASSSAAETSAAASSSNAAASTTSPSAEDTIISWQGALVDGTLIDYITSDDGKNGGFVLTKNDKEEPKRWLGTLTASNDGKITITDDTTKESISFTLEDADTSGAVTIDVEGYGKGALVPMSAADWQRVAEAEELKKTLETAVNWVGAFEDGTPVVYMDTESGTEAALAIAPLKSSEMKTWTGKVSGDNGKVTITDDQTKESITIGITNVEEDGTLVIESDEYGKGILVKMTVGDWLTVDELTKSSSSKA